jgi:leader peptidase (prepilin peptidase)/N-methyltransferase
MKGYQMLPKLIFYAFISLSGIMFGHYLKRYCNRILKAENLWIQNPLIETTNGILYSFIFGVNGWNITSILYCLLTSALIALSVIDFYTFQIPFSINMFIFNLGIIHVFLDYWNWINYALGFLSVGMFMYLIYALTKGHGIGGGDVKLLVVCGLLLGWERIILALFLGCLLGSVIHLIRMKVSRGNHILALGPYLSAGIWVAALWGDEIIHWYSTVYQP